MKITKKQIKTFEENQKLYGTKLALHQFCIEPVIILLDKMGIYFIRKVEGKNIWIWNDKKNEK